MRCRSLRTVAASLMLAGALLTPVMMQAEEGMWTFDNPPAKQLQEKYHFTPAKEWLDHVRLASVRLNDGGSGSFVSPHGLLLTNHHVALGQLQKNSTAEHDYIKNGFYAATPDQEMKSPDLEVNVLVSMEDVTGRVQSSLKKAKNAEEEFAARKSVIAEIERESQEKTGLRSDIVTLYQGGEYWLYCYKKYTDVRLVFAPEEQIAFFGGDTDNFTYPRYDLDLALFRVYENGKPIESKDFLRWNPKGAADNELVFVPGHPGSTQRQDTVAQLKLERDVIEPAILKVYKQRLDVLAKYATQGPEQARQVEERSRRLENSRKAFEGRLEGLLDVKVMDKKQQEENEFQKMVMANPQWKAAYGGAWKAIAEAESKAASREKEQFFHGIDSTLADFARIIVHYVAEVKKPDGERLEGYHQSQLDSLQFQLSSGAPIYKAMEIARITGALEQDLSEVGPDDPFIKMVLNGRAPKDAATELVNGTKLDDPAVRKKLMDGGEAAVTASDDSMIVLARKLDPMRREFIKWTEDNVESVLQRAGEQLGKSALCRLWTDHLSRRDLYAAAFLWPGEGLPDERHRGALQDDVLRIVRPSNQLRLRRPVRSAQPLQRGPRQTRPGDTGQLRDQQRCDWRQLGLTGDQSQRGDCRLDFRRQHRVAGGRFRLQSRQKPVRRRAHRRYDGGVAQAVRRTSTGQRVATGSETELIPLKVKHHGYHQVSTGRRPHPARLV